jgi:hypothetical protein
VGRELTDDESEFDQPGYRKFATVNEWIRRGMMRQLHVYRVTDAELNDTVHERIGDPTFTRLRANRIKLGYRRYELYGRNAAYNAIGSAIERLREYQTSGNLELLVDAANLVEVEWNNRSVNPGARLVSSDDGEHVTESD